MAATDNPYSPPKAVVADVSDTPMMERPRSVNIALILLLAGVVLGLLQYVVAWLGGDKSATVPYVLGQVLGIALALWVYYKIWQGRNWARILTLVLYSLVLIAFTVGVWAISHGLVPVDSSVMGLSLVLQIVQLLLDVVAIYLLFVPGRAWFRPRY